MPLPEEPAIADLPSSPSEAFALGWRMAWTEKRIMRCPNKGLPDSETVDPCPACGATISGADPVRGICQAVD